MTYYHDRLRWRLETGALVVVLAAALGVAAVVVYLRPPCPATPPSSAAGATVEDDPGTFDARYAALGAGDADGGGGGHDGAPGTSRYPAVALAKIAAGKYGRPRAAVVGTVKSVTKQADGDYHILLTDGTYTIVCEMVPDMVRIGAGGIPMDPAGIKRPRAGMRIKIRGIVRRERLVGGPPGP